MGNPSLQSLYRARSPEVCSCLRAVRDGNSGAVMLYSFNYKQHSHPRIVVHTLIQEVDLLVS